MARRTTKRSTSKRGRPKATAGKPSAKQEEVKRLLDMGQSIDEIASLMETTPGAIKAQISRLRKLGVTVAPTQGRTVPERSDDEAAALIEASQGVEPSVEEHIASELAATDERLAVVGATISDLTEEQVELTDRKGRLEAAGAELNGGKSHLTAVA